MAQPILTSSIYILHDIYFSYKELKPQSANLRLVYETKLAAPRPQARAGGAERCVAAHSSRLEAHASSSFQEANRSNSGTNDLARLKAHLSIRVDGKIVALHMFIDRMLVARTGGFSALRIRLDFIGDRRECPELSLLLWCLSVPEALTTGPISGEVRRRK